MQKKSAKLQMSVQVFFGSVELLHYWETFISRSYSFCVAYSW